MSTQATSVGEDFPAQQARVRAIQRHARAIGPAGAFLVASTEQALREAEAAAASGDVIAILSAYKTAQRGLAQVLSGLGRSSVVGHRDGGALKARFPSDYAYSRAALSLSCEYAVIRAVAAAEAGPAGAFLDTGEPVVLYERHIFSRLTEGRFDGMMLTGRSISDPQRSKTYGPAGEYQHRRLQLASSLDRDAALKSCSWGLFQIMGFNFVDAGHDTIQSFVNAMYLSVDHHLEAFVSFIGASPRRREPLIAKDWDAFARAYNGPGNVPHYAAKLAHAYAMVSPEPALLR